MVNCGVRESADAGALDHSTTASTIRTATAKPSWIMVRDMLTNLVHHKRLPFRRS